MYILPFNQYFSLTEKKRRKQISFAQMMKQKADADDAKRQADDSEKSDDTKANSKIDVDVNVTCK